MDLFIHHHCQSSNATTSAHSKLVYTFRRNSSPTMADQSAYMTSPGGAAPSTGGAQSAYMTSPGGAAPSSGGAQSAYMTSPTYNQPEPAPVCFVGGLAYKMTNDFFY
jgi:hypothetical protein